MRYVMSGREAKEMDRYSIAQIGIPSVVLMERAAEAVTAAVLQEIRSDQKIWIVAGFGNNGADALAVARMLQHRHYENIRICAVGNRERATQEWQLQERILNQLGMTVEPYEKGLLDAADAVVDGVFGIGLSREVSGIYYDCIAEINSLNSLVYAVDISSGIHADTGAILGICVKAHRTITFGCEKLGSILYPGAEYSGKVEIADIGFPECAAAKVRPRVVRFEPDDLHRLPVRPAYSNKGTFGKVLLMAGGKNMAGAAYLSAYAAYRVGAGLVRILTVEENRTILQTLLPEAILTVLGEEAEWEAQITECVNWATVVAAGPGLGTGNGAERMMDCLLNVCQKPLILDADGLNLLALHPQWSDRLPTQCILTPHLGEMSRLLQTPIPQLQSALIEQAQLLAEKYHAVAVCKDARTVVAAEGEPVYLNVSGCSAMAKGGSGDVLCGTIGGLMAQHVKAYEAARLGVYIHGLAGEAAAREKGSYGVLASDLAAKLLDVE